MNKLLVTANKLNKRSSVPVSLSEKTTVVGTIMKGATFLGDEVSGITDPSLGKWYRDRDGHFYWGGGLMVIEANIPVPASPPAALLPTGQVVPATGNDIGVDTLRKIFRTAAPAHLNELAAAFNLGYNAFSLDTSLRRAHFFAQMLEEVGTAASTKAENMNYSYEGLINTFGYFKRHPEEAKKYGRTAAHVADQVEIANRAYSNRKDLGNSDIASGDGWNYRGKGFIQLTGKANYKNAQAHIDAKLPGSGVNIVTNADDILTVKGAMLSAMAFFSMNKIHTIADAGTGDWVVDKVTRVVNSKTASYAKRVAHFHNMKAVFGI